jgi:hypothetical protein
MLESLKRGGESHAPFRTSDFLILVVFFLVLPGVIAARWWIYSKTSFPRTFSLAMLVPVATLFIFLWLAYGD